MFEHDGGGESVQLLPTLLHGGGSGQAAVHEKGKEWGGWWGWMGMGGGPAPNLGTPATRPALPPAPAPKNIKF